METCDPIEKLYFSDDSNTPEPPNLARAGPGRVLGQPARAQILLENRNGSYVARVFSGLIRKITSLVIRIARIALRCGGQATFDA